MTRKPLTLLAALLLSVLLVAPALAQDAGTPATNGQAVTAGPVSQAQLDLIKKREERMMRHQEMIKKRLEVIQAAEQGSPPPRQQQLPAAQ